MRCPHQIVHTLPISWRDGRLIKAHPGPTCLRFKGPFTSPVDQLVGEVKLQRQKNTLTPSLHLSAWLHLLGLLSRKQEDLTSEAAQAGGEAVAECFSALAHMDLLSRLSAWKQEDLTSKATWQGKGWRQSVWPMWTHCPCPLFS